MLTDTKVTMPARGLILNQTRRTSRAVDKAHRQECQGQSEGALAQAIPGCTSDHHRPLDSYHFAQGILIADDEPSVRGFLQVVLGQQGFAVWQASDGHEAVRLYQRHQREIVLVLLDVRMPGRDGPLTLAAMQDVNPAVVCCFMTGDAGDYTQQDLLRQGAAYVFPKPLALAEFRTVLGRLLTPVHARERGI
jgi:CheY-like chemotaxis protein